MFFVSPRPVAIVDFACDGFQESNARRQGSYAGIVKSQLLSWIDIGVGTAPSGTIKFVDIAPPLVEQQTAALASAIRKYHYVLAQCPTP